MELSDDKDRGTAEHGLFSELMAVCLSLVSDSNGMLQTVITPTDLLIHHS